MVLEIPDSAIAEMPITSAELLLELSIWLYHSRRFSLGQARKMAGLSVIDFQKELVKRDLYLNYDMEDWQHDSRIAKQIFQRLNQS